MDVPWEKTHSNFFSNRMESQATHDEELAQTSYERFVTGTNDSIEPRRRTSPTNAVKGKSEQELFEMQVSLDLVRQALNSLDAHSNQLQGDAYTRL